MIFKNILIVCVGNICRSPIAEKVFQKKKPDLVFNSAGISALVGNPMDDTAMNILLSNGYASTEHKAKKVNLEMMQKADLILTMENAHQDRLIKDYPQASGRVMLLGKWVNNIEISDPYKKSREAFTHVFKQIEKSCEEWIRVLESD